MGRAATGPVSSHRSQAGRVLKTRQVRTGNIHGPQSLLMALDIYDWYLQHITPPQVQSGLNCRGGHRLSCMRLLTLNNIIATIMAIISEILSGWHYSKYGSHVTFIRFAVNGR